MNSQEIMYVCTIVLTYILYRKAYILISMGNKNIPLSVFSCIPLIIFFYYLCGFEITLSAGLTITICLINYFVKQKDISSPLRAKKVASISSFPKFVNVSDVQNNKISTYPRLTIVQDIDDIIFDSSDFEVINEIFKNKSFNANNILYFNNIEYKIVNIKVDLLTIFDDYSALGHTPRYKGKSIPYNMQLFIKVEER
jgi:hypothetical protein